MNLLGLIVGLVMILAIFLAALFAVMSLVMNPRIPVWACILAVAVVDVFTIIATIGVVKAASSRRTEGNVEVSTAWAWTLVVFVAVTTIFMLVTNRRIDRLERKVAELERKR